MLKVTFFRWKFLNHTRLKIAISMNNKVSYVTVLILRVKRGNPESEAMLFSVPDFIGFACHEVGKNELTTSPVAVMIIIAR